MSKQYKTMIFCDFDGTITTEETFVESIRRISEQQDLEHWFGLFQRGDITLRQCTEKLFSLVPSDRYHLIQEYAETVTVRDGFLDFLREAKRRGCPVVVLSGGIRRMQTAILAPYMEYILDFYSCDLDTTGQYMAFSSPHSDERENMCKARIMDTYRYERSVCIGDSVADISMARHAGLVFARDGLVDYMREHRLPYVEWNDFHDIISAMKKYDF